MTLIASICCSEGALIAADSKSTESSTGDLLIDQSFPTQKLFALGPSIVWGSAGSGGVCERVRLALDADLKSNPGTYGQRPAVEDRFRQIATAVMKQEFAALTLPLPLAIQMRVAPFGQVFLFAGIDNGTPWVTEVTWDGQMTHYAAQGFHAIGSGGLAALTTYQLLQHHTAREAPLDRARVILYRIMDVCIRSSAGGLGPPIQMWEISGDGSRQIPANELKAISDTVKIWEGEEQSCLRGIAGPTQTASDDPSGVQTSGKDS